MIVSKTNRERKAKLLLHHKDKFSEPSFLSINYHLLLRILRVLHEADIATTNVLDSSNDIVHRRDRTGRAVASEGFRGSFPGGIF